MLSKFPLTLVKRALPQVVYPIRLFSDDERETQQRKGNRRPEGILFGEQRYERRPRREDSGRGFGDRQPRDYRDNRDQRD